MEQRISVITLGVRNLARSKAFYDALGWRMDSSREEEGAIIAYNLHASTLCLYPWDGLAEDAQVDSSGSGFRGVTLAYNVSTREEVDQVLAEAEQVGGSIVKLAQDTFWGGYSGYFADPDGMLWEVAWNPFSPLGPNHEFQW